MIKKNKIMILGFVLLVFFIEKCTVINIISSPLFKNSKYDKYSYLQDGLNTGKTEVIRISESPYNAIGYDEKGNYFIVYGDDNIRKINSEGVEEFSIARKDGVSFAKLGAFVFTDTMVYDLSKETIKKTKIKEIIHATGAQLELQGFLSLLRRYYQKARVVIYATENTFSNKNHKVYLKIGDDWIALYISNNSSVAINFHFSGEILKEFPQKHASLILLKNPVNKVYSTRSAGNEIFSSFPDSPVLTTEGEMEYPKGEKIHISFYQKEKTLGVIAYTSIPVSFRGTAYFDLKIGKEAYKFKDMGSKNVGFITPVKHNISYYVLPEKYKNSSEVSFLKVFPPSSLHDIGSKGLYVVRPNAFPSEGLEM